MGTNRNIKDELSWWEYEHYLKGIDYTIVGSGIVGLSVAIELNTMDPSCKILIVDKKRLPIGASTKNAGFACFGSISEILDDYDSYGTRICKKLIRMRWEGLSIMKSRIPAQDMLYNGNPGAEIFKSNDEYDYYMSQLSFANSLVSSIVKNEQCFYAQQGQFGNEIINKLEGSLNPQMMMKELELIARNRGILFMSGIEVNDINYDEKFLNTNLGCMNYNKLIICTNGFSRPLIPNRDIKPARNQVFITNKIPGFKLDFCYHMNKGYVYFREYNGRLLIGGGRDLDKEGETTDELGTTELITSYLKEIVQKYILPNQTYTIEHSWSGILGVGETKIPMVEMIDKDVLVAIRMGGMGIAIGSFIGKVATDMLLSNDNRALRLYVS